MVDSGALVAELRRSTLFRDASEPWLAKVASRSTRRQYPRGHFLWHEGDRVTSFAVVIAGLVELHRAAPDREDAILGLFGPGDTIGIPAVIENDRYAISAVAASRRVDAISVDAEQVLTQLDGDARLANAANKVLLEHIRALRTKIDIMSCANLSRGLATLLLDLGRRFGRPAKPEWIPVELSRARMAHMLGAREETVIRLLAGWRKDGWVDFTPNGFEIRDRARLERLQSGDNCHIQRLTISENCSKR